MILASRGPIFNATPDKYDGLSTWTNNDKTGVFWQVKIIVKTESFDATRLEGLHILVKSVVFCRFAHVGITTPQQNDCLGPNSLKSIVFLKVALTDHAFLHVFDMLEGWSWPACRWVVRRHGHRPWSSMGRRWSSMGPPPGFKGRRWVPPGFQRSSMVVDGSSMVVDGLSMVINNFWNAVWRWGRASRPQQTRHHHIYIYIYIYIYRERERERD